MKTTPLIVALALLGASSLWASEKNSNKPPGKGLVKKENSIYTEAPHREKNVPLTGSYIKRDIRRNGVLTDGPHPVYVLDRRTIDLSGAADLSQVLMRTGFRR